MVKCPKCGEEIGELVAYSTEQNKRTVTLTRHGSLDWSVAEPVECSGVKDEFECPSCQARLFTTDGMSDQPKEVIQFLKGAK